MFLWHVLILGLHFSVDQSIETSIPLLIALTFLKGNVTPLDAVTEVTRKLSIDLKEKQLEAILEFLSGKDVFVSLPTGYGKSLIYEILPLVFDILKGIILL